MIQPLKPIKKFLGPLGRPDDGGYSLKDAVERGREVRELLEHPGWRILVEAIEECQRAEQKMLMRSPTKDEQSYDRLIGQWAGMEKVPAIAEGIAEYGQEAEAQLAQERAA